MKSESECENPNNDFLQEDQLDYDFNKILTKLFQYPYCSISASVYITFTFHQCELSCAHSSHTEVPYGC